VIGGLLPILIIDFIVKVSFMSSLVLVTKKIQGTKTVVFGGLQRF
jgi:hypothetical protein